MMATTADSKKYFQWIQCNGIKCETKIVLAAEILKPRGFTVICPNCEKILKATMTAEAITQYLRIKKDAGG